MANSVRLAGWDASRTDSDPKYAFGRFVQDWQASGKPYNADAVRAFVAQDPRWEVDPATAAGSDPHIRVKQTALDTWKPGTSIYQDVIKDSGPGGANAPMFENAGGAGPAVAPARPAASGSSWWTQNAPATQGSVGALMAPLTPALQMPTPGSVGQLMGAY